MIERRKFLTGLGLLFAAPAIVHASSLMRVRPIVQARAGFLVCGTDQFGNAISEMIYPNMVEGMSLATNTLFHDIESIKPMDDAIKTVTLGGDFLSGEREFYVNVPQNVRAKEFKRWYETGKNDDGILGLTRQSRQRQIDAGWIAYHDQMAVEPPCEKVLVDKAAIRAEVMASVATGQWREDFEALGDLAEHEVAKSRLENHRYRALAAQTGDWGETPDQVAFDSNESGRLDRLWLSGAI